MLAAAIGIDRGLEPDIGAVVAGDDRAGLVGEELGRDPLRSRLLAIDCQRLEAVGRVAGSAASAWGAGLGVSSGHENTLA